MRIISEVSRIGQHTGVAAAILAVSILAGCKSDPAIVADGDGDGVSDEADVFPDDPCWAYDRDRDGTGDESDRDRDGDRIANRVEILAGLNPNDPTDGVAALKSGDADGDGILDAFAEMDLDGDGLVSRDDADADGDGYSNDDEHRRGSDRLDAASIPLLPRSTSRKCTLKRKAGWYKGDLHFHTNYSDDARGQGGDDMAMAIAIAEWGDRLNFIALTDHRQIRGHFDPAFISDKIILLAGEEFGGSGHAGAWEVETFIDHEPAGSQTRTQAIQHAIDLTNLQGGLFSINHPMDCSVCWPWKVDGYKAIEVWNQQWIFRAWELTPQELEADATGKGLDPATANPYFFYARDLTGSGDTAQALKFYYGHLNDGWRLAAVGGGDRHMLFEPGYPTTHVYAESLSNRGILEGIAARHAYVTARPEGLSVRFEADGDGDGLYESMTGDVLPSPVAAARFRAVIEGANQGRLTIVQNDQRVSRVDIVGDPFIYEFERMFAGLPAGHRQHWVSLEIEEPVDRTLYPKVWQYIDRHQHEEDIGGLADLIELFIDLPRNPADESLLYTYQIPVELSRVLNATYENFEPTGYAMAALTTAIFADPR